MLNLDTHILFYAFSGDLTARERRARSADVWRISAIVLWEIAKLVQLHRIELDIDSADFSRFLSPVKVWPLTFDVCTAIRELDFKSDPADELIAATSVMNRIPLVTRDEKLRRSAVVP